MARQTLCLETKQKKKKLEITNESLTKRDWVVLRSAIAIYYAEHDAVWPLSLDTSGNSTLSRKPMRLPTN